MRAGHIRKNASGGEGGGRDQLYDINCTLHTGRMIHENWTSRKQARGGWWRICFMGSEGEIGGVTGSNSRTMGE